MQKKCQKNVKKKAAARATSSSACVAVGLPRRPADRRSPAGAARVPSLQHMHSRNVLPPLVPLGSC